MKKVVLIISVTFLFAGFSFSQNETEKEAIKEVIRSGYVDGLMNYGDTEVTKKCFHPDFYITILSNNGLAKYNISDWIKNVEKTKADGKVPDRKVSVEFAMIDITKYAAVAKLNLSDNNNKQLYTDYLLLYKFEEGWKIVQKIYYEYGHN